MSRTWVWHLNYFKNWFCDFHPDAKMTCRCV
jgi:hypothetical protein